jgi:thymidine phosphorylase
LRLRRLGVDTRHEAVVFMREDCHACRSEGFEAEARVEIHARRRSLVATLQVVTSNLLRPGEVSLSESAWVRLGVREGDTIAIKHAPPLLSLAHVRGKIAGRRFTSAALDEIIADMARGAWSEMELAAFVTACASRGLDRRETTALTRAMIDVGERLDWGREIVADKHSVGGLPGNRTTLIVVPIVAACGVTIPKTSSRAITSPAGTADTMAVLTSVDLDARRVRRVVEREGGCIAWGGSMGLSPADEVLIRVERPLDLDPPGQLVASVISKKAAAGATHVVLDMPVGPTAKVRTPRAARELAALLEHVGRRVGLRVRVLTSDGRQPVGRGIGPALEARDALAVLQCEPEAPADLRDRSLRLAAAILELAGAARSGSGAALARRTLESGAALRKMVAICVAQGGLREPPIATLRRALPAPRAGRVTEMDNRVISKIAKLAGAPDAPAAGLEMRVRLGDRVLRGEPLLVIHAQTRAELDYAWANLPRLGTPVTVTRA